MNNYSLPVSGDPMTQSGTLDSGLKRAWLTGHSMGKRSDEKIWMKTTPSSHLLVEYTSHCGTKGACVYRMS